MTRANLPRLAGLCGVCLLALGLITVALPLGGVAEAGADALSLGLGALVLLLAAVAGYLGSSVGAVAFALLVGLLGPYLATSVGPRPDAEFISVFSVPVILVPVLLFAGFVGVVARWW